MGHLNIVFVVYKDIGALLIVESTMRYFCFPFHIIDFMGRFIVYLMFSCNTRMLKLKFMF